MKLQSITRRLQLLRHQLYLDLAPAEETLFLASSGRSGSTWIQDILCQTDRYRILFEPYHSKKIELLSDWEYRQYIGRNDSGTAFLKGAGAILRGEIRHRWIDQDNKHVLPRQRFIKDIRANLFIAWLKQQFPHLRLVFLTRHPFAVAKSRMKLGWGASPSDFFRQKLLVERHFSNDLEYLASLSSEFAKQVAFWSLENVIPLRELEETDALAVAYEDIQEDPERELKRLSERFGLNTAKINHQHLSKPSRTAWAPAKQTQISDADRQEAYEVLCHFGLDQLYGRDEAVAPRLGERKIFDEFPWSPNPAEALKV